MTLTLPYPPTTNSYWRHVVLGKRRATLLSRRGRQYREDVGHAVLRQWRGGPLKDRLAVSITAVMPDRRARDLDNILKATLDALTHAGVWLDDGQIDRLTVARGAVCKPGELRVMIETLNGKESPCL